MILIEEILISGVTPTVSSDSPRRLTSSEEVRRAEKIKHGSSETTVSTLSRNKIVLVNGNGFIHHWIRTPLTPLMP
ncbi:hypothetical protein L5515_013193 [Caenorhabditis briggsae]|uniref:Uncharacterized protein n=1 Tax=Caenorhabditis briggsae TaxID=6238 RepID=A0AAE9J5X9_CAEBR|nr:hypothetical protein L5515_013193 [Caenorhabditis briggsae]